jgi:histidinol-phosphate/aromatic aminotransferase/cobyric acid decarboxylase-like protein
MSEIKGCSPCFHGGAFFDAVGDEFDCLARGESVLNADVLDAWFPPAPAVLEQLREHLPWLLRTSPPVDAAGLVRTIARLRGVPPECLLAGPGSSALIFLAFGRWLTPASRVLLLDPMYGEYAHVCERLIGCRVERFPLQRQQAYRLDPEAWVAQLRRGYDLAVVVNPNNPTGRPVTRAAWGDVLRSIPERTRVWMDEAYLDYIGAEQSLEAVAAASSNVVVCKSLSKVYALSGARVAYLCGIAALLDELRRWTPPWSVSLPAQVAAVAALQALAYYRQRYSETHVLRQRLTDGLCAAIPGLEVVPGSANFVLCHLPPGGPDADGLLRRCRERGLFLRDVTNMGARLGRDAFRVAVKAPATQERLLVIVGEAWADCIKERPCCSVT